MKKALITGIAGQDGSYLAEYLLEKDYRVFGVDLVSTIRDPLRLWRIAHIVDQIELFPASVEDYPRIREVIERVHPDECYHLAASSFVSYEFDDIFSMFNTNFHGTHSLLNAILETVPECRIYYAGSSEMFGDTRESPQNEETPFYPRSAYGISKLSGFHLARNFRDTHGLFISTGIAYNHESERRSPEFVTRKITKKVAEIHAGMATELRLGNLNARRDWGYAPNYVQMMWLMLQQSEPDVYVIATGKSHSVRDFVEQAFKIVDLNWEEYVIVDEEFFRPSEKVELVGDARKAKRQLSWKPKIDFDGIIEKMVMHDIQEIQA
jgi:GDPmannose 4,6-dehydratase